MKTVTISTKEIRDDLEGFLKRLKHGQTIQVMFRSKPLVTVAALQETDPYLAPGAGTPAAARHSVELARKLAKRSPTFDPDTSFKDLYKESQSL